MKQTIHYSKKFVLLMNFYDTGTVMMFVSGYCPNSRGCPRRQCHSFQLFTAQVSTCTATRLEKIK